LLCYSITSKHSYDSLPSYRDIIVREKDDQIPIVLVGLKSDLDSQREVSIIMAQQLAMEWKCPFFEVSAKQNENVDIIFMTLAAEMDNLNQVLIAEPTKFKAKKNKQHQHQHCNDCFVQIWRGVQVLVLPPDCNNDRRRSTRSVRRWRRLRRTPWRWPTSRRRRRSMRRPMIRSSIEFWMIYAPLCV